METECYFALGLHFNFKTFKKNENILAIGMSQRFRKRNQCPRQKVGNVSNDKFPDRLTV